MQTKDNSIEITDPYPSKRPMSQASFQKAEELELEFNPD